MIINIQADSMTILGTIPWDRFSIDVLLLVRPLQQELCKGFLQNKGFVFPNALNFRHQIGNEKDVVAVRHNCYQNDGEPLLTDSWYLKFPKAGSHFATTVIG